MTAMTAANGAVTSLTTSNTPVLGGISATQYSTWETLLTWFEQLTNATGANSNESYNGDDIPTSWETLTIDSGTTPVINTIEVFEDGDGACAQLIVSWKNTTPASITYDFGDTAATSQGSQTWSLADDYLSQIQVSDDAVTSGTALAINFVSS